MTPTSEFSAAIPPAFELSFVRPLIGLNEFTAFKVEQFDDTGALFTLASVEPQGPHLFLVRPEIFFPDYEPTLSAETAAELGTDAVQVLVTLTLGTGIAEHRANLSAPIMWNPHTGAAVQVVLEDDRWSVRTPLLQGA